jgi:hypothetical protein
VEDLIVIQKEGKVVLKAGAAYTIPGKTLCKIKDTGNGFIAKFPAWNNTDQDNYVCLDYSEAEYLMKGLKLLIDEHENCGETA